MKTASDTAAHGYRNLYLATDHVGCYEQYGFSYIGTGYHHGANRRGFTAPI